MASAVPGRVTCTAQNAQVAVSQFEQPCPAANAMAGTSRACDTRVGSSNTMERTENA